MSVLFALVAQAGFDGDQMGGGWGWLVIGAIVVMMGGMGAMMRGAGSKEGGSSEDPVEVLRARCARGELTTEEFRERLRTIEDARS